MDSQQLIIIDKLFLLLHEGIKLVLLLKIVDELSKCQDDVTRQNLSLALGSILQLGPHMAQFQNNEQPYY